ILSILAFLSPIVLWRQPGPMLGPPVHRWRGRDITLAPRRTGLIGEIRYQIWRLRNRR
ncbi:MAG: hypothetical protein IRY97_10295, partial [Thermomicrobiaceae bacterium]|nr:hypothetical protein [Thermomicrobiaceae bacterium]